MSDLAPFARVVHELNFLAALLQTEPGHAANAIPRANCGVTIISGFLGAGKTTLLRRILQGDHGKRLGVIVNDFGAVNLDAAAIAQDHGDVIELTNGCSCCAMGRDFGAALERIAGGDNAPDHVLVEASGLADPAALATIAAGTRHGCAVGVVTLVDAESVDAWQAGALGSLFERQIDAAHLIVLTKTNSLGPASLERLKGQLAGRFPGRRIVTDRQIDPVMLFTAQAFGARPLPVPVDHDLSRVVTRQIESQRTWTKAALSKQLEGMPGGILRMKGWVRMAGGRLCEVQCVGPKFRLDPSGRLDEPAGLILIGLRECEDDWADWITGFGAVQPA